MKSNKGYFQHREPSETTMVEAWETKGNGTKWTIRVCANDFIYKVEDKSLPEALRTASKELAGLI